MTIDLYNTKRKGYHMLNKILLGLWTLNVIALTLGSMAMYVCYLQYTGHARYEHTVSYEPQPVKQAKADDIRDIFPAYKTGNK